MDSWWWYIFLQHNAGVFQTGVTYHIENGVLFKTHHIPLIHLHDKAKTPIAKKRFLKVHFKDYNTSVYKALSLAYISTMAVHHSIR